jgi:hypothetical protein
METKLSVEDTLNPLDELFAKEFEVCFIGDEKGVHRVIQTQRNGVWVDIVPNGALKDLQNTIDIAKVLKGPLPMRVVTYEITQILEIK